jgi:hypothetical protein
MRRSIAILFAVTLGWAVLAGASTASADTIVSLTFDDGNADQMPAVQMLDDHGMAGTFYIITNRVGRPDGYMTWDQVQTIFDHGNEIGGHTRDHIHLNDSDYSNAEIQNQICGGRQDLLARGYHQVSFAYPFGDHDARSEGYVQSCGYLSGRGVSGLQQEDGEPDANSIPPENPWVVHTRGSIDVEDTLPEVKDWIVKAEELDDTNGPTDAWIPLVWHHLCDPDGTIDCSDEDGVDNQYMTPDDFDSLLDWLQARQLTGTHVETMEQVMTGQAPDDTTPPTSSIQCNGAACSGFYNPSVNVTLSGSDTGGSGLKSIHYTTDGSTPDASDPSVAKGGSVPISSTTTLKFRAEDNAGNLETATNSKLIQIDSVKPTSSIQCNGATCQSGFYNQNVSVALSATDSGGSALKEIRYTTNGSDPTTSSTKYTSPFTVSSAGANQIKFRAWDNAGNAEATKSQDIKIDKTAPTSSIQCNNATCQSGFYNQNVSVTLAASDAGGSDVKEIRYTTNGNDPTSSSTLYAGPFTVSSEGTNQIKFRAWDNAGNAEAVKSQTISIDKTAPTNGAIQCNGSACQSGFYNAAVQATFSASDGGGSGLNGIRYTTDNSTPNGSSPLYVPGTSAPVSVGSTTTVKFRAQDKAGNLEAPVSMQPINVDTAKPTSSIQCDGAACVSVYNHSVNATLSGNDTGGSALKNIRYTTDGTDPTGSSPVYSAAIPVNSTTTIKWRAEDNAGNVESVHSQTITIDTVAPTSSIKCDGAACSDNFYNHSVNATLTATPVGGASIKEIRYTTDGSNPTSSSPKYNAAIPVTSTTTIKFRAEDSVGNIESPAKSQLIKIDTAKPTSSIQCDGVACQPSYDHPVSVALSANDTGGSGLKEIRYTTDGDDPTGSSPLYTTGNPITVSADTTIKWRAEDNAGNVESVKSQTIAITSPPPDGGGGGDGGGAPGSAGSAGGTLGAFSAFKSLPNGTVKLTLQLTGPGEIVALDGAVTKASAAAGKQRKHRIRRTSKSVTQAGLVTLVIKPSKAGKRALRRKGKLTVPVRIIFTAATGSPVTQTVKVKLRLR